jgi:hypothetical protein
MKYTSIEDAKKKLLSKIKVENGCWLWQGAVVNGYGRIKLTNFLGSNKAKSLGAHRVSYLVFKGDIADGLYVCHTCDIPTCINPEHLFLGTHSDNMRDMVAKGRQVTPPPSAVFYEKMLGNNFAGKRVLADGIEYPSYVAAAKALGVSDNTIRKRIKNGWEGYSKLPQNYS